MELINLSKKLLRFLLVSIGFLFFGFGTAGIILPILPTVPFYLLAALFFGKGSRLFHNWFLRTKLYNKHLESYANNRCMTIKAKLSILIPVTVILLLSMVLVNMQIIRIILIILLLVKYWYFLFMIKTVKSVEKEMPNYM